MWGYTRWRRTSKIPPCIVTSSNVFNECAVLKNSANVINIIKSAELKATVNNNPINLFPLIPACTARPGLPLSPPETAFLESPYYRPRSAIAITQQTSIQSPTHKPMTLHSKPDPTNHFCACGLFSKWNIQQNYFVFVEFWTTFFRVSTCFNGSAAAMDAQLGFGTRLRWFCDRGVW